MHTIHPKCDDSNFSILFGADRVESMHIGTQRLALFERISHSNESIELMIQ